MKRTRCFNKGVCIRIPRNSVDERTMFNLKNLLENNEEFLKKALCIDCIDIVARETYIDFPWFHKETEKVDIENAFLIILHLIQHANECNHIALIKSKNTKTKKADCEEFLYQIGLISDSFSDLITRICSRFV